MQVGRERGSESEQRCQRQEKEAFRELKNDLAEGLAREGAGEANGWCFAEPGFLGLATQTPSAWQESPACRLPAL